jgi:hypothetical protein
MNSELFLLSRKYKELRLNIIPGLLDYNDDSNVALRNVGN